MSETAATGSVEIKVESDNTEFFRHRGPTNQVVLFNKMSGGYALWVGGEIIVQNNQIFHFPYVIENGFNSEFIGTLREFKKRYEFVGVL